jgi:cytochrome c peroxidase
LFTDHFFHSTRVPPLDPARPDPGRAAGAIAVRQDPFNCLGPFSDAKPAQCAELRFMVIHDPALRRAFKTPGLRGVALRPPYMHAGQFATLPEVIRHYVKAPETVIAATPSGHTHGLGSELNPLTLSEAEIAELVAFLGTLSGPVVETPAP